MNSQNSGDTSSRALFSTCVINDITLQNHRILSDQKKKNVPDPKDSPNAACPRMVELGHGTLSPEVNS